MKSISRAHVVVVADSERCSLLTARLHRMEVARVTAVDNLEEARCLCRAGGASVCLVALDETGCEAAAADGDAPGRDSGVPALMLVDVVTPHCCRLARRSGYLAVIPTKIEPRLFYRRLGGALQRRCAARPNRPRRSVPLHFGVCRQSVAELAGLRKQTLH
jgi:DNA-binding NtrC family response regulator